MKTLMLMLAIFLSAMHAFAQEPVWSKKYHTGSMTCLDFSGDGGKLLSGGEDQAIRLWDVLKGDTIKTFKSIKAKIDNVDFNITGEWFIASWCSYGSPANTSKINITKDSIIRNIYCEPSIPNVGMIRSNLLVSVLSNNDSNIVTLWSGESLWPKISTRDAAISRYAIDGKTSGSIGTIFVMYYTQFTKWSTDAKREKLYIQGFVRDIKKKTETSVFSIPSPYWQLGISAATFISNDKQLLIATDLGKIYITNYESSQVVDSLGSPTDLAILLANDLLNRYYISAHADSTLRLWTPGIPNIFKRILLKSPVTTIAVSPDSVHFATAHTDGTVALWNIDSLAQYAVVDSVFTPGIDSVSHDQNLCKGTNAEFTVSAKSNFGEGLSYQWQKGGVNLAESDSVHGVTSATLLLKDIDKSAAGSYSVVVASLKGANTISSPMQLIVRDIPVIAEQPIAKAELQRGQTFVLKVVVVDTANAQFQWFKNGSAITAATKSQYQFLVDSASEGIYTVRITNQCGNVISNESVIMTSTTGIAEENSFKNTQLSAEPNPFKNSTTIRYSLPNSLKIKLAVTDILGREVAILKDDFVEMGEQSVVFKNENLPEGTYFITLSGDGFLQTIPVQIIR